MRVNRKVPLVGLMIIFNFFGLKSQNTSVYVSPHPDDWQLFMNPNAYQSIKNSTEKVIFLHTTAGDAGSGISDEYYLAREQGSLRGLRFMSNTFLSGIGSNMYATTVNINGHSILKYSYRNIVAYFLRLPDGSIDGSGFAIHNYASLKKLYEGTISSIPTIDAASSYTLADLKTTIRALIESETNGSGTIQFNLPESDLNINPGDNSDHINSSLIMQDVANDMGNIDIRLYVGYHTALEEQNIFDDDLLINVGTWGATSSGLGDYYAHSSWDETHLGWVDRQYFRILDNHVNYYPTAVDDNEQILVNDTLYSSVSLNDYDLNDSPIVYSLVSNVNHGSLTLDTDGTYTYIPDTNFIGVDNFVYRVCDKDNDCSTATVTITVTSVLDYLPVAIDDNETINANATLNGTVAANDTGLEDTPVIFNLDSDVNHGTLTFNTNGTYTYIPNQGYAGIDSFTYTVCDADNDCSSAVVTITINEILNNINLALNKPTIASGYESASSYAVDGIINTNNWWGAYPYPQWWQVDLEGEYAINQLKVVNYYDGVRYYQYNIEFSLDGVNWSNIVDFSNNTSLATSNGNTFDINNVTVRYLRVNMTYNSVNRGVHIVEFEAYGNFPSDHQPIAVDDTETMFTNQTLNGYVSTNDSGLEDTPVSFSIDTDVNNGTLNLNTNGSFTYTPNLDYTGVDSFAYTVCDADNDCSSAVVNITITPVPDNQPTAVNDTDTIIANQTLNGNVSTNDSGLEDTPVSFSIDTDVNNGTLNLNTNGSFTYTPNLDYTGVDSFAYTVCDADNDCSSAVVNITIVPTPDNQPIAVNDTETMDANQTLNGDVSTNDSGLEDTPVNYSLDTDVNHGTLNLNTNGSFTYTPNLDYTGVDSFAYTVCDADNDCSSAVVNITIVPVPDNQPIAVNDTETMDANQTLNGNVSTNDSGLEDTPVSYSIDTDVIHGTLNLSTNGSFTYTPNLDYTGVDSFTYTVCDADNDCSSAVVNITINSINITNIALNKSTVASSYETESDFAVDGIINTSNWWGANPYPQWLQVDLEGEYSINQLKVINYYDGYRYYQYTIESSLDGVSWTNIVDFTTNTTPATSSGNTFNVSNVSARYLRVNLLYNSANSGVHIVEFEVYGAPLINNNSLKLATLSATTLTTQSTVEINSSDEETLPVSSLSQEEILVTVFPNPITSGEDINLELNMPDDGDIYVEIFNISGKVLLQNNYSLLSGLNRIKISSKELFPGTYFIRIQAFNKTERRTIILQ